MTSMLNGLKYWMVLPSQSFWLEFMGRPFSALVVKTPVLDFIDTVLHGLLNCRAGNYGCWFNGKIWKDKIDEPIITYHHCNSSSFHQLSGFEQSTAGAFRGLWQMVLGKSQAQAARSQTCCRGARCVAGGAVQLVMCQTCQICKVVRKWYRDV